MSHSPLLGLPGPPPSLLADVGTALAAARDVVHDYDPDLVVLFAPDHYNGFYYRLMPPFCVGTAARGVGDYGTQSGALDVPSDLAYGCAEAAWAADVDVAVSTGMDVDHATAQPLELLFGDIAARPVVPVFVNSVAVPLAPLRRARLLGAAIGRYLAGLDRRVLVIGSGGLSHDPPVPTLASPPEVLERIVHGRPPTAGERQARQTAVIEAAAGFARGETDLRPLNPGWDQRVLDVLDQGRLAELDGWSNAAITREGGNSAHEIRTWVAAFAALAAVGPYRVRTRYYRPAPELIAGFAVRTAFPR
ncbi:3-(2,3-dihydroxyphenyl)propionate dioxygenase [Parafrankia colletiae]|uniref:2,3-dihydroxyphenylpropionate/2,3-dihydroxicinnamic acid 1,2-dioxygenase n=1 Tax=Parafrankia colletiae TaxID=573497 RepID=A0A1S1QFZ4_9ACTN|nr:3-(2,3-dihydroxyphenyl)propionate dioxygenase [Parafrankia colletiae]